ncbi:MAG: hypothetical protein GF331_25710 [Chitinivibrionales bacterium]|nr:hypothetical protein [Chitinivibrionales bacterium]
MSITDDGEHELSETITIALSGARGASLRAPSTGTITIAASDGPVDTELLMGESVTCSARDSIVFVMEPKWILTGPAVGTWVP